MDVSRRRFLRGNVQPHSNDIRLPWIISESVLLDGCTRCGDCISACPQKIVVKGDGGFPKLDFSNRECTFCGQCATACQQPLFDLGAEPWQYIAAIGEQCLTFNGIVCQNCKDACQPRAIRFRFGKGGMSRPEVDGDACTGCGACIAPCPNDSISLQTNVMSF